MVVISKKVKTILVTGCAGFIGSNFVNSFKEQFPKTKIVGIDDFSTGRRDAVNRGIVFYEGSIVDEKLLDRIFKKHRPEYIFHFAAIPRVSYSIKYPVKTSVANIIGTVAILEKAKEYKAKRLIFSSSSSVYGGAKVLPTKEKENLSCPCSFYALQKYSGEYFCRLFSEIFGLETVCLRYFNVFGPGQYGDSPYSTVISAWLTGLYFPNKKNLFMEGDGRQSRDFCYVDNVIQANIKAMLSKKVYQGEVFNIAHGERTSLSEVKRLIEKCTGKRLDLKKFPIRIGDVRHTYADISKACNWFGYVPYVHFEEGLKKTVEWFKSLRLKN